MNLNLYGILNTRYVTAVFYAAEDARSARNYVFQDLNWPYWDMEEAYLLRRDVPGEVGRVSPDEALSLLELPDG